MSGGAGHLGESCLRSFSIRPVLNSSPRHRPRHSCRRSCARRFNRDSESAQPHSTARVPPTRGVLARDTVAATIAASMDGIKGSISCAFRVVLDHLSGAIRSLPTAVLDARLFTSARAGAGAAGGGGGDGSDDEIELGFGGDGGGGGGGGSGGSGDARTPPTGAALSYPASRATPSPNPKLDILSWALCGATPSSQQHAQRSVSVDDGGGHNFEFSLTPTTHPRPAPPADGITTRPKATVTGASRERGGVRSVWSRPGPAATARRQRGGAVRGGLRSRWRLSGVLAAASITPFLVGGMS